MIYLTKLQKKTYSDEHQEQIPYTRVTNPDAAVDRTSPIHLGNIRNEVDFIVPQGVPVLAAVDGTITYSRG